MKRRLLFILLLIATGVRPCFSQNEASFKADSLLIHGGLGVLGRWQTGNLNQISIMPNGRVSVSNSSHYAAINTTYHYLKVNGFNAVNDLWVYGLYQHQPNRRVFPSIHTIAGFAASYQIDHSIVAGAGAGLNVYKKSPAKFLQAHLFGSYMNFQYIAEKAHIAFVIGSLVRAIFPINDHIHFRWELSSFHSTKTASFWGGGNLFQVNVLVLKNLSANIRHQTYYNQQVAPGIKNTNTEMLFGIQYSF